MYKGLHVCSRQYTPIPNIVVRSERNKQQADERKGLWESPNQFIYPWYLRSYPNGR